MMTRFCRYAEKVFQLGSWIAGVTDSRPKAQVPAPAVFASALTMFALRLGSL